MIWLEVVVSFIMGTVGGYLLYRGKKIQEPKLMLWGAALIILSYFLFSGGKDDEASKTILKSLVPSTSEQQP